MITFSNVTFNDVLFVFMCMLYFKLIVDFAASLAPPPKKRKRGGVWREDETRGERKDSKNDPK